MSWLSLSLFAQGTLDDRTKTDIKGLINDYVSAVSQKQMDKVKTSADFLSYASQDSEDFANCAKGGCEVKFRGDVEIMEWKDPSTASFPHFQVQFDIIQNNKTLAQRPGCYVIEKRDQALIMDVYISECDED